MTDDAPSISSCGDPWILGKHRLICGDARDHAVYARLLAGEHAPMVFTDPPYNVPVNGHVCGLGSVTHAEVAMASGQMSEAEFHDFLATVFGHLAKASKDGSIHYARMDWRHMCEILAAGDEAYTELKNLVVWNKDNGGMAASTARSTSWCLCSRTVVRRTSTFSSSASVVVIAPMSEIMRA